MKLIAAALLLLIPTGCGFDWFPSTTTFTNASTASTTFGTTTTAKRQLFIEGKYSSAGEPQSRYQVPVSAPDPINAKTQ